MKKLFLLSTLIFVNFLFAQNKVQWRATYQYKRIYSETEKKRMDSLLKEKPEYAEIMKQVQKRMDNKTYFLDFNKTESVFIEKEKLDATNKGFFMMGMSPKDRIIYKDLKKHLYLKKAPLFREKYIIKDSLINYKWKITNESKKIGNYTVIKAEGVKLSGKKILNNKSFKKADDIKPEVKEVKITAWFTPEIPIGNGPDLYDGLPGLIMELQSPSEIYLCNEIAINPKKINEIKKPEDGKVVSGDEYSKISKESFGKMKKMYKNNRNGKNNSRTIIIR